MTTTPEIQNRKISNRRRIRNLIQEMILSGQRRSGDRLVQQDLARQFGVSQSIVRESLIELQFSGLVRIVDNLGVFVNGIGTEQMLQAWEIREVLEGLAAKSCCQQANRLDIDHFHQLNDEMYRAALDEENAQRGVLDRSLHDQMIQVAKNEVLQRLTEGYRILGLAVQARREISQIYQEHQEIIRAIEENRPQDAEALARSHVRASRTALEQAIHEGRFHSDWVVDSSGNEEA